MLTASQTRPPNNLRVLRAGPRLTQREVARSLGMSQSRYSLIENGHLDATPAEQQALAGLFGVSVRKVFPPSPKVA